jgi:hypothetical protein
MIGKAKAAGPEVKRGRTDLAETLWQSSNPYKDGRTLGDQWLEAKGKQRADGPEMRRGRRVRLSSNFPLIGYALVWLQLGACVWSTSSCVALGIVHLTCGNVRLSLPP